MRGCSGVHGTSNPSSRRRANHSLSCVAMSTADPFVVGFPPLDFDRVLSQSVLSRATPAASAPAGSGLDVEFLDKCPRSAQFVPRQSTFPETPFSRLVVLRCRFGPSNSTLLRWLYAMGPFIRNRADPSDSVVWDDGTAEHHTHVVNRKGRDASEFRRRSGVVRHLFDSIASNRPGCFRLDDRT